MLAKRKVERKQKDQPVIDMELMELPKERTRLEIIKLNLEIAKLKREDVKIVLHVLFALKIVIAIIVLFKEQPSKGFFYATPMECCSYFFL
jgi:hypothetical protein